VLGHGELQNAAKKRKKPDFVLVELLTYTLDVHNATRRQTFLVYKSDRTPPSMNEEIPA
jgi:hypothetical protein